MRLWFRSHSVVFALLAALDTARGPLGAGMAVAQAFYLPTHPRASQACLLALASLQLWAAFGAPRGAARAALLSALAALSVLGLWGVCSYVQLVTSGAIRSSWWAPFSALSALLPLASAALVLRPPAAVEATWARRGKAALGVAASLLGCEVLYIHAFGLTDYRRPAEVIVVLGAKVYEDGTPSEALAERVATGVELYRQGYSKKLLVSGGIGREGHDEAAVMKRLAVRMGVAEGDVVEDNQGNNTEATLVNAKAWLEARGGGRALVVSHYHHLPRVKLLGLRRGVACYTVPADEGERLLAGTPYYVAREALALAYYYLRG